MILPNKITEGETLSVMKGGQKIGLSDCGLSAIQ